jgi:dihydrofolate reductase
VLEFGEEQWPYGDKPILLLSTQASNGLQLRQGVQSCSSIEAALEIVRSKGYKDIWVDGGATIRAFLAKQLVTEMVLTTVPIALGEGLALFDGIEKDLHFEVVASEVMGNLLATKYRVSYDKVV